MTQVPIVVHEYNILKQHFTNEWIHYRADYLLNLDSLLLNTLEYVQVITLNSFATYVTTASYLELRYSLEDTTYQHTIPIHI